jgi:hypothetical protein
MAVLDPLATVEHRMLRMAAQNGVVIVLWGGNALAGSALEFDGFPLRSKLRTFLFLFRFMYRKGRSIVVAKLSREKREDSEAREHPRQRESGMFERPD